MDDYRELQMGGDIIKPIKYHIGEWKVLSEFFSDIPYTAKILDVGCGVGYGVGMLKLLGYRDVLGVDINPDKITVGKRLGYNVVCKNIIEFEPKDKFDVVWCSHAFEHMDNPRQAIMKLKEITSDDAQMFFILPHPDFDPAPAHTSSEYLGLCEDDVGLTTKCWFMYHGLDVLNFTFGSFREPEIWIRCKKQQSL